MRESVNVCVCVSLFYSVEYYTFYDDAEEDVRSIPSSYHQPNGKGQSLSRRYCKHSVWFFLCA